MVALFLLEGLLIKPLKGNRLWWNPWSSESEDVLNTLKTIKKLGITYKKKNNVYEIYGYGLNSFVSNLTIICFSVIVWGIASVSIYTVTLAYLGERVKIKVSDLSKSDQKFLKKLVWDGKKVGSLLIKSLSEKNQKLIGTNQKILVDQNLDSNESLGRTFRD